MLNFLDTSNWQGGYSPALTGADAVIVKATEGTYFVDPYCDSVIQQCKSAGLPWGFYHFASDSWFATEEAQYFVDNCRNYFGHGVPVLDWEGTQSTDWVNKFVEHVHEETGVWPWIYANPCRFDQGVNQNCARWVASYPDVASPTWDQARGWDCPAADGNVVAWQFCSDGAVNGIAGDVDLDLFYGSKEQWQAYARGYNGPDSGGNDGWANHDDLAILENDTYKVTVERK